MNIEVGRFRTEGILWKLASTIRSQKRPHQKSSKASISASNNPHFNTSLFLSLLKKLHHLTRQMKIKSLVFHLSKSVNILATFQNTDFFFQFFNFNHNNSFWDCCQAFVELWENSAHIILSLHVCIMGTFLCCLIIDFCFLCFNLFLLL